MASDSNQLAAAHQEAALPFFFSPSINPSIAGLLSPPKPNQGANFPKDYLPAAITTQSEHRCCTQSAPLLLLLLLLLLHLLLLLLLLLLRFCVMGAIFVSTSRSFLVSNFFVLFTLIDVLDHCDFAVNIVCYFRKLTGIIWMDCAHSLVSSMFTVI